MIGHMGGARSYVPKAIRERSEVKVLQKKVRSVQAAADAAAPAWVQQIFSSGGAAAAPAATTAAGPPTADQQLPQQQQQQQQQQQRNRFARAEGVASKRGREAEGREAARQRGERERAQKLKARSAQRGVVRLRTSKGQPLLGARMKGLLGKVERLVGPGGSSGSSGSGNSGIGSGRR
jgi:hypothetical protein